MRPQRGALVTGRGGGEDDFVGVDLCGVAGEGEFGDCAEVGGHSGRGDTLVIWYGGEGGGGGTHFPSCPKLNSFWT